MKRLIAQRPVFYQGRSYRRGEALPAGDSLMTAAWLRAGSARWETPEGPETPEEAGGGKRGRRR